MEHNDEHDPGMPLHMDHYPKVRRFQLQTENIETLEDVKKILDAMNIRIETDNPHWNEVSKFFTLEIIPRGFFKLLHKIGWEGLAELHFHEMEEQAAALLEEGEDGYGYQILDEDDPFAPYVSNSDD